MKLIRKIHNSWWVGLIALLCFAPLAFGQTVDLTLDNGGPYSMDGIYVGPYNATVNNQPSQIICDDFAHEVTAGESWVAKVTLVSSLNSSDVGGLTWGNAGNSGIGLGGQTGSVLQGYVAMAYLASEMLPLSGNPNNATQVGYLAYAIWAIFDASAVESWLNNPTVWQKVQALAESALNGAVAGTYTASQFAGWEILTPIAGSNGPPQEFFIYVPEGGSTLVYLLLAGFCCFGTMFFRSRRRGTASDVV